MSSLLAFNSIAADRGDGLRPELVEALRRTDDCPRGRLPTGLEPASSTNSVSTALYPAEATVACLPSEM